MKKFKFFKKSLSLLLLASMSLSACNTNTSNANKTSDDKDDEAKTETSTEVVTSKEETKNSKEKTVVRMSYWNSEESMKTLLEYFEQEAPDIKVEFQFIDNKQYDNVIETQLASGAGPDIIGSNPTNMVSHAQLGYIEPVDKYSDKFSESGKSSYMYDGKLYAVPGISWFEGMFYNKEIFEKNNIAVPKTFPEVLEVHQKLQDLGIKPQAMGAKSWEPMMKSSMGYVLNDFISTDAGKDFDKQFAKGEKTLDGNWNKSIEKWSELIKRGFINKEMLGIDYDQALEEFAMGKAAMWESGPWALESIKEKNPELKFDMFPFYGDDEGVGYLIGGPGVGFEINATSEVKDAAYRILDLLCSEEGQKAFWQDNQGGSSYYVGLELPLPEEFNGVAETIKAGNVYAPWDNWASGGILIQDYGKYFQELLAGEKTVDEVLKAIDKRADELR